MTTIEYVAFVNTTRDCEIAGSLYSDATAVRISLESAPKTCLNLPNGPKRWLDASIDGLHVSIQRITPAYGNHVKKFSGFDRIGDPQFQEKPDAKIVQSFVYAALDACSTHSPDWLSVPQLPLMDDSSRNKINRLLAESSRRWKEERSFSGLFILPVIFTNQRQMNRKTERNKKLVQVLSCFTASLYCEPFSR